MKKHGLSKTKLYQVWRSIKNRCEGKGGEKDILNYKERNIKMCETWKDFVNFYNDMLPTYQPGLEIDRIDNDGDYYKENCRWVTHSVNNQNRRKFKNSASKYKGVLKSGNKWKVSVKKDNIRYYVGSFVNEADAAKAYNKKALELYGEQAKLNVIEEPNGV